MTAPNIAASSGGDRTPDAGPVSGPVTGRHDVLVARRWNGWRVSCRACFDYGIYDSEHDARRAARDHQAGFDA